MRIQISLTVSESKRLIAKGIKYLPVVTKALKEGRVILKGGTTTSAISEEICNQPLRLSGRFVPEGALTARDKVGPHSILIERGNVKGIDDSWDEAISKLQADDVFITGANVIDAFGNAALAIGVRGGGPPGKSLSSIFGEGVKVIIAAGTEKMISGDLRHLFPKVGRKCVDSSYGAAVGLLPLLGNLFTEIDSITLLAKVDCFIIAKGGMGGMEGGTTVVIEGEPGEVEKIDQIYQGVKGSGISGIPGSLPNCESPNPYCNEHMACIYKKGKKTCFK